ncbi:zf-HC2 domain-containing protein [Streptomyces sp. NPDC048639]|uniref:zf-HC2 domain-containing protein n=1 Tax=Streptomyces sp. NPDC048639 TaxID=3365581 RepID=UPI003719DAF9
MRTQQHLATGAYALGIMDPADAWHFEAHLDECATCVAQLREFAGIETLLAGLAATWPPGETWLPQPSHGLLDRVTGEVATARRAGRKRRLYLVAAAAALVVGGSVVGGLAASGPGPAPPADPGEKVLAVNEKVRHTDTSSGVSAMVSMTQRVWGTDVGIEVRNVRGPLTCTLVAVGKHGEEETVSTWSVPERGYGVPGTITENKALRSEGGAAMDRRDIDRFEVRTLDGKRLVAVDA